MKEAQNWDEFEELWRQRHENAAFNTALARLQALDEECERISYSAEEEYEILWRRARALHFAAMQAAEGNNRTTAAEFFQRGRDYAERAVFLMPDRVEGQFWVGVCLLEAARLQGKPATLFVLRRATRFLEAAEKRDETYHFAGALRVLGRVYHFKPLLLGGLLDRAIAFYRRALQVSPGNSTTMLYLAEALLADRQPLEAKRLLREIIAAPRNEKWVWEQARDQAKARALLSQCG